MPKLPSEYMGRPILRAAGGARPTILTPMPAYPHIEHYREELQRLKQYGGSDSEGSIRRAFENCLDAYCRDHQHKLALIAELITKRGIQPDGTVKDSLRMARGYWEAKDTHDDLDEEIQKKFDRGYPRDNIIFEDSETAVLIQNREETMRVDMSRAGELHRLIRHFLDYELPEIQKFRQAQQQFKIDLPEVLQNLRQSIDAAAGANPSYQATAAEFLNLCRDTISPSVTPADVREMLLQHILTKDIFLRVFAEDQFHRENNVAKHLDALEHTFFTGDVRREAIDRLRTYYGAIGRAADEIADYAERQTFLKAIYEDFYKAYNPKAADRLGVVYTPNEIVDFMIRGTDYLLEKHFGRRLADDNVHILDPATGTGTFITNLIKYLPVDRLEHKYLNELHANEVAILPYYIANLNIEHTYKERTGKYREFPNLCFVDTLDNMGWEGASGAAVQRQGAFELGAVSEENWMRIELQNEKPISVIIGNPPYNANQQNENDNNKNREYRDVDKRIKDTYVAESSAQKTKQYDMYKRFIRWASDRLADDGIIAFVLNRAFLDSRQDDGFRKVIAEEFNELWAIDLKGNARTSGERRRKEAGNIFQDKIRVGVAIYFLVRKSKGRSFRFLYDAVDDYAKASEKLNYVKRQQLPKMVFRTIRPARDGRWLDQSDTEFGDLLAVADRQTKHAKTESAEQAIFKTNALGVNTARDGWTYDFDVTNLRHKTLFFADTFNWLMDEGDGSFPNEIKWSRDLKDQFRRERRIVFDDASLVRTLYRPFTVMHHFADFTMNDVLTKHHYAMFGDTLKQPNRVINVCRNGRQFYTLAAGMLTDWHFTGDTHCLPLYRYSDEGDCVSNITTYGLRQFRDHYDDPSISAEDIFAYTYAVLHDPVYRETYAVDLLQELPRLPFHDDFREWVRIGQALLDLHIGFETADLWPLERVEEKKSPGKPTLRADKQRGVITLDGQTKLTGVPADAWDYVLGSRSALEWVLDQHKEKKPRDPTIREKFDTYRFADHKERVIDLLRRVCTVSVRTMELIDELPNGA